MTFRTSQSPPVDRDAVAAAAGLLGAALKGALATLEPVTGAPYASLVLVATAGDGAPVLLLSRLALHTRNIAHDARASLLIDGTDASGDPMAGGRVSLSGTIAASLTPLSRERFLSRHPSAAAYADFPDFAFYRFEIASAHLIRGFGRIVDIAGADLIG